MRTSDYFGSGAGPTPLGSPSSGSLSVYPVEMFQTPQLDLTVPNLNVEVVPARPGYVAVLLVNLNSFLIELVAGTQTSPLHAQAGSDPAHSNIFAPTTTVPSNADVNGANVPSLGGGLNAAALTSRLFSDAPIFLDITAGAQGTGGFALRGKFIVRIRWVAA